MTIEDYRRLALSLPEAIESSHTGHPDFRAGGRIFATLWPSESRGVVMLNPEQQYEFVKAHPAIFEPVKGGWGLKGSTNVILDRADKVTVRRALETAWRNATAKKAPAKKSSKPSRVRSQR
jgi:hypothetical protein